VLRFETGANRTELSRQSQHTDLTLDTFKFRLQAIESSLPASVRQRTRHYVPSRVCLVSVRLRLLEVRREAQPSPTNSYHTLVEGIDLTKLGTPETPIPRMKRHPGHSHQAASALRCSDGVKMCPAGVRTAVGASQEVAAPAPGSP
jgi:hypothetical protein